jgi:release factor glutamine methyltransferase
MLYSDLYTNSLKVFANQNKTLEIQILIEEAFHFSRAEFWMRKDELITDLAALRTFYRYRNRLLKDEPIAYMLKKKEFYGETFSINKNVLIPRPETEILVEKALDLIKKPIQILDIGAGSGVIGIVLAKRTRSRVTAVEYSKEALYVLKKNIRLHGIGKRVLEVRADLFPLSGGLYDMIVSNPPYIPEGEWRELDVTVREYEPKIALVGGKDGLLFIKRIVEGAPQYLKPGGWLLMEIGYNQEKQVHKLLEMAGFRDIAIYEDYSHIPRIAAGQIKK